MVIRTFVYVCVGLALFTIWLLSASPMVFPDYPPWLRWLIGLFLIAVWIGFDRLFGVWSDLADWLRGKRNRGQAQERETEAEGLERRLHEAPDLVAAEAIHGPLPTDLKMLYRSGRYLEEQVELQDGDDVEIMIERFLPIDLRFDGGLFPFLAERPWVAIAHDGFGNLYAIRNDHNDRERTPIFFFDHESCDDPIPTKWTVFDLLEELDRSRSRSRSRSKATPVS